MIFEYYGRVLDWHDGDTCHADLDLGLGIVLAAFDLSGAATLSLRMYGMNAPELSTAAGKAAQVAAVGICPPGTNVKVTSHGWDKYGGRIDATLTLPDGSDFATRMIAAGQAVPYFP